MRLPVLVFPQCGFTVSGGALLVAVHGSQTDGGRLEADDASGATLHLHLSLPLINWVKVSLTSLLQVPPAGRVRGVPASQAAAGSLEQGLCTVSAHGVSIFSL